MMCKSRCFLFLLWSIVVVTYCKDVKRKPKCEIVKPYLSDYVSADLNKLIKGKGCSTNNTTPNKQAVHVVNLKVKDDQLTDGKRTKVNLRIEQLQNNDLDVYNDYVDYGRPLVFVLNSDKPVKWKVELSRIGQSVNIKNLFVVPSHSSIRFKKTMIKVRGKKMSLQNYNNKTDLVRWAKRKYKAVTTYSEVEGTNMIFRVGIEKDAGIKCDLSRLGESQHILTSHKLHQTITGCTTQGRKHYLTKPVFIIELKHAPQSDIPESIVDLDITSFNNEPLTKDFYLILKSPANIKWRIRSWKIQGSINIVTDAESNLKGIRMQTVASRREVMSSTGQKLIQWAEKYIAAVESYTAIDVANKVKLQLRSENVRGGPIQPKPPTNDDDLRDIIHTDCSRGQFTVIFPNYLLQEWALVKEQITLLDRRCTAKENSTHIILQSSLNDCMTKHIQVDDNLRYSNAIVIHAAVDTDFLLEDLGSGYMEPSEMSGGGSNANTYMDDEDFKSRKVEIDVQCEQPKVDIQTEKPVVIIPDTKGYRLELYSSEYYNDAITTSPIEIKNKQRIYIEASIASDIPVKVQFEDCWLSPSRLSANDNIIGTEQHQLITNGCAKDPNIQWQNFNAGGNGKMFKHLNPFSRFSFPFLDHFNGQETYLYCQLSQCQMHFLDSINIPECPSSSQEECKDHLPPGINSLPRHRLDTVNYQLLSIGPISIITTDDSDISPSGDQTGSGAEDNQQPHSVIIEGLDSATVVGIAFAAFAIGILLTGTLWFIHTHTGSSKHVLSSHGSTETTGELSPNTQVPISA